MTNSKSNTSNVNLEPVLKAAIISCLIAKDVELRLADLMAKGAMQIYAADGKSSDPVDTGVIVTADPEQQAAGAKITKAQERAMAKPFWPLSLIRRHYGLARDLQGMKDLLTAAGLQTMTMRNVITVEKTYAPTELGKQYCTKVRGYYYWKPAIEGLLGETEK